MIFVSWTDAQSYTSRTVDSVLLSAENETKKKYLDAVEARHASFTPFVTSIDGILAREANTVIKLLATKIVLKWEKPLSEVTGWVLRATNLCIRGSRVKWRTEVQCTWMMGLDYPHQLMNRICMCYYVCACA